MRTLVLLFGLLLVFGAAACRKPSAAVAPRSLQESRRQAFKDLNTMLVRLEEYLSRLKDADMKTLAEDSARGLKRRREALRADFSTMAYEELRLDILIDLRRLAAWVAEQEEQTRAPLEGKR